MERILPSKHTWITVVVGIALACLNAMGAEPPDGLPRGLRLYMSFEGSTQPAFCTGAADVRFVAGSIAKGRVGCGAVVVGNASVSLPAPGNLHRPHGTLAFWHKPQWQPTDPSDGPRMLVAATHFQLVWSAPDRLLYFMTGAAKIGAGFFWDYSVAAELPVDWVVDQWHHFALCWDSRTGEKALYLDGRKVGQGKTKWIRGGDSGLDGRITLGSPTAMGCYDEWLIWDRVLSDGEIASLCRDPEAVAKSLSTRSSAKSETQPPVQFDLVRLEPERTIVAPGETFRLPTNACNRTSAPLQLDLRLTVVDVFNAVVENRAHSLQLKPAETKPLTFDLLARPNGVFKLRADFEWHKQPFRVDLGGFAVWPKGALGPSADSFFGHHINAWHNGTMIRQAARLGLSWVRGVDMLQATNWTRIQPEPGEPQWTHDFQLAFCKQANLQVLGTFYSTPYWAANPPRPKPSGDAGAPIYVKPRMDLFEQYVRRTVERHRGSIRVWEVWNEPNVPMFWNGSPEEYARLAEIACREAKIADPACIVLVGAFGGEMPREWIERCAIAGAFARADGLSFHGYCSTVEERCTQIKIALDIARRYSPARSPLPIWNTEWGIDDTTFLIDADVPGLPPRRFLPHASFLEGAAMAVQLEAVTLAAGVERSFYYFHNEFDWPGAYQNLSAIEYTGMPRPKLLARTALEFLTCGTTPYHTIQHTGRCPMTAVVFSRKAGGSLAVAWATGENGLEIKWPRLADIERFDLFANPMPQNNRPSLQLSQVPIYLRASCSVQELAKALASCATGLPGDLELRRGGVWPKLSPLAVSLQRIQGGNGSGVVAVPAATAPITTWRPSDGTPWASSR
jgi:hypothetical protein